ncbi:TPA: type I-E CRISPR-associated protein Cas6/Cse3/CasE [Burkholderia lata]
MYGGEKKQPVPLPDLDDWVNAQLQKHGYAPQALQVSNVSMVSGMKQGMRIQLQSVRATGMLHVTDTLLAQAAFTNGIGRGKRFGFGMLLLKN